MPYNIFSEREKAKQEADTYRYDEIPEGLRNQIFYVLSDLVRSMVNRQMGEEEWFWYGFWEDYSREKGLSPYYKKDRGHKVIFYERLMQEQNAAKDILDMIDIAFQFVANRLRLATIQLQRLHPRFSNYDLERAQEAHQRAADILNTYFQRASVGYRIKGNQMIRIDSEHLHSEVIVPVLDFLRGDEFESANKEFLSALEKYRTGDYEHCITDANSAFESVMKVICNRRGLNSKGAADELVKTLSKEGFVPNYLQSYFTLGLPPLRHKQGSAHGKGDRITKVPAYMAGYALHLAATNILFFMQRDESEK